MPEVVPSTAPYRPTWEDSGGTYYDGSAYVPILAPNEFFTITGSGAVWSDHSDSTLDTTRADTVTDPMGGTIGLTPFPVADLPAAPGVTSIVSLTFRALGRPTSEETPIAIWRLHNRTTGAIVASNNFSLPTTSPANYTPPCTFGSFSDALPLLQAGNLCVGVALKGGGTGIELDVFDVWLTVNGVAPPPPDPEVVVLRRAVVVQARRGDPSLRMLQRGGTGGMSGIWRMVGNPTTRDSLRRGPGSIL